MREPAGHPRRAAVQGVIDHNAPITVALGVEGAAAVLRSVLCLDEQVHNATMIALLALHVVSAVIWVGGMAFAYLVLRPSVGPLDPATRIAGARVTCLPVDGMGRINPSDLRKAITPRTLLVSIMHANNEGGLLYPRSAPINIW